MTALLLVQAGYAIVGAVTGGPGSLAADRGTALVAGLLVVFWSLALLVLIRRSRTVGGVEIAGFIAGVTSMGIALFGQLANPDTAGGVVAYEAIAIAVIAFAVPWRVMTHYAWVLVSVPLVLAGLTVVEGAALRGALLGAFAFSCMVALVSKPLLWNARVRAHRQGAEVQRLVAELRLMSRRDPLTGLGTRLALDEQLADVAGRPAGRVAFLMIDLDLFKPVNDLRGHQAGDDALRRIAATMQASIRTSDRLFRYGGDEFLAVLDRVDDAGPEAVAERLRAVVEACEIANPASPGGVLTVSIGTASVELPAQVADLVAAIAVADAGSYAAKHAGRNRVVAGSSPAEAGSSRVESGPATH